MIFIIWFHLQHLLLKKQLQVLIQGYYSYNKISINLNIKISSINCIQGHFLK